MGFYCCVTLWNVNDLKQSRLDIVSRWKSEEFAKFLRIFEEIWRENFWILKFGFNFIDNEAMWHHSWTLPIVRWHNREASPALSLRTSILIISYTTNFSSLSLALVKLKILFRPENCAKKQKVDEEKKLKQINTPQTLDSLSITWPSVAMLFQIL